MDYLMEQHALELFNIPKTYSNPYGVQKEVQWPANRSQKQRAHKKLISTHTEEERQNVKTCTHRTRLYLRKAIHRLK